MATIAAWIKFVTNTDELVRNLKSGEDAVFALQGAAEKTMRSLGGEGLIRAANNAAVAVEKLGGASKLTGGESERLATMLDKAIVKYQTMGQTAPSALKALLDATRANTDQAKKLADETAAVQRNVQAFSGAKVISEANQIATAVAQVGGANKLTAGEQTRVNALVTEAIAKYHALGQEAPNALHALQAQTSQLVHTVEPLPAHLQNVEQKSTLASKAGDILGSSFARVASAFALGSLIDRAVSGLVSWAKEAIDSAGATVDLANKTGLSTETIQRMSFVAKQTGGDVNTFAQAAFKLGITISEGTAKARKAAEDLGLSWQQLRAMKPDEQFATVVKALEAMEDPQRRNTDAVALFKKTAAEMMSAVGAGYTEIAGKAKVAGDGQVRALKEASDAWEAFVADRKTDLTTLLGSIVIGVGKQGILGAIGNLATNNVSAIALSMAPEKKPHADINLPASAPVPESYIASLKAAEQGYRSLTGAQKSEIEAGLQLNQSNDDIINSLGITDGVLSIAKKAYEEHKSAISKAAEEARKYAEAVRQVEGSLDSLAPVTVARIEALLKQGKAEEVVATYLKVTKDQVRQVAEAEKNRLELAKLAIVRPLTQMPGVQVESFEDMKRAMTENFNQARDFRNKLDLLNTAGTQRQILLIKQERDVVIAGIEERRVKSEIGYQEDLDNATAYYNHLQRVALGTADTIVERMQAAGVATIADLQHTAEVTRTNYLQMKGAVDEYTGEAVFDSGALAVAWQKSVDAQIAASARLSSTYAVLLGAIGQAFSELASHTSGSTAAILGNIGHIADALKTAHAQGKGGILAPIFDKDAPASAKWAAGIQAGTAIASGAMEVWSATAADGTKKMGALHGAMAGAKAGAAFGPYGMAIGAAAGAMIGFIHAMSAGRRAVEDFAKSAGGFDALHKQMEILGADGERLWIQLTQGTKKGDKAGAQKVIDEITKSLDAAKQKDAQFNTTLGQTLSQIQKWGGGVSGALRPYLDGLAKAGRLTQENANLLSSMTDDGKVTWEQLSDAVGRYGGDISKLPGTFQDARMHDSWQQIIDDMDLFERGGVSANDALDLMAGKISDLVNQSVKFGTEIPANMKPWVEQLIASGKLVDDDGNKITDIGKLKFGETLQTSLQNLNDTLKTLIETFQKVPGAVNAIPKDVTTTVHTRYETSGIKPPYDGSTPPEETSTAATGGYVGMGRVLPFLGGGFVPAVPDYFTNGTLGRLINFIPKGTDTVPAMLTPGEIVLNAAQQKHVAESIEGREGRAVDRPVSIAIHISAMDGASVQRVVESREFQDELERQILRNPNGLGTVIRKAVA